MILTNK
ncbi:hypothetical protein YPPY101_2309, partial [Yersinia pestis PY-101]